MHSSGHSILSRDVPLYHVHLVALRAKYFDSAAPKFFTQPHRKALLVVAESTGAEAKACCYVLGHHFGQTLSRADVPVVEQAINVNCVLHKLEILLVLQVLLGRSGGLVQMLDVKVELFFSHIFLRDVEV